MEAGKAFRDLARTVRMLVFCFSFPLVCLSADWPQYRGPNHDGVSLENIRTNWSEVPPRQVWKVRLDPALSSLAISGGRVFTQVRRLLSSVEQEFCIALNADTGEEIWAAPLGIALYDGGVGDDDGPRSTPSVDGNRVYVLSSYLRLVCLDAATGAEIWSKDLVEEYGGVVIGWQNAASPLIVGDLVIVNGNAPNQCLMAFHKQDGTVAWQRHNDGMTHATPVTANMVGVDQIIFYAQSGLVSVAPDTGNVLWRFAVNYNGVSVAASPVVAGDRVYCSRAYPTPAGALVVGVKNSTGAFTATQVWGRTNQLLNHWCTPVHHQGYLYGMFGQGILTFKCVEFATGLERWSLSGFGYGSVLVVGGNILALSDSGELILVAPNPTAYSEIARFRPLTGKCWNVAAVSNGRIYLRSTTEAVCLDVVPPALRLRPELAAGDVFRLFVGNADGSPLVSNRATNIVVLSTTNLANGVGGWLPLTNPVIFTNGQLRLDDPESRSKSRRFYRAEERP
jgi:outer membrane protein assembly factor BamB